MIAFIEGTLAKKTGNSVIVTTAAGLGYEIFVPVKILEQMLPVGNPVSLHTHLQVKEDGMALFGFLTEEELRIFKLLITVSGIGPKGALGILSGISIEDLRFAVLSEDVKTISKIPGIGAKTAGKLILELKDKINVMEENVFSKEAVSVAGQAFYVKEEAAQALVALGYSMTEAKKVLKNVEVTQTTTVEQVLQQALKNL